MTIFIKLYAVIIIMAKHIILSDKETESFNKAKGKLITEEPLEKITDSIAVKKLADKFTRGKNGRSKNRNDN